MAGFTSIFGLLLQVLLIIVVAQLIFAWWRRRNLAAAPSYAVPTPAAGQNFGSPSGILNSTRSQRRRGEMVGSNLSSVRKTKI